MSLSCLTPLFSKNSTYQVSSYLQEVPLAELTELKFCSPPPHPHQNAGWIITNPIRAYSISDHPNWAPLSRAPKLCWGRLRICQGPGLWVSKYHWIFRFFRFQDAVSRTPGTSSVKLEKGIGVDNDEVRKSLSKCVCIVFLWSYSEYFGSGVHRPPVEEQETVNVCTDSKGNLS